MKPSEINRKMKMSLDGGGRGQLRSTSYKPTKQRPGIIDEVAAADLVLAFKYHGELKIIKDRFDTIKTDEKEKLPYAINKFSFILSKMIFGENDLKMFQEGLNSQIQEAIEDTIKKFHTKRR
jgi:hypothetical protein